MSQQFKKTFRCTEEVNDQIKKYAKKINVSESKFITTAIQYFIKNEGVEYIGLYEAINQMLENHQKKTDEELKRIRLGVNQIAKESQMSVEFWNTYFNEKGNGSLLLTDVNKTNEVALAESSVQSRISDMQQKKYR